MTDMIKKRLQMQLDVLTNLQSETIDKLLRSALPCLRSLRVAVKYCETCADPLCSISQGSRWTAARCVWSSDGT